MSELRHFLRYQIPGLMFFVHLNVFLRGTGKICSREQLLKLIAPEFLIAVLLGWIIYQIYDTLNPEAHCMKRSIEKVIAWTKIKKKKNKKIIAKHAIQIGLYSNIKQTKEKKIIELEKADGWKETVQAHNRRVQRTTSHHRWLLFFKT